MSYTALGNPLKGQLFTPLSAETPGSAYATLNTRNNHPMLQFDTTTQWSAYFTSKVPTSANLVLGCTVYAQWASAAATSGTIGWDIAFERMDSNGQDLDSDAFGTPQTITATTVPAAAGVTLVTSVAFTQAQLPANLANGDMYRVRIRRDVANDNAAGNAELYSLEVRWN